MPGGLIQLVAYGAQDVYLTSNPQITFFKSVYRRYTNFSSEVIRNTFIGGAKFGSKASTQIARNGDLLSKVYLRVEISSAQVASPRKWAWVQNLGHALVKSIELSIGGQRIDYHTSDWMHIWYELSHQIAHERGYNKIIGNTPELTTLDESHDNVTLYIPLQFFFCRHVGQSLPLIALQYHEVKIDIEFERLENLLITSGVDASTLGLEITDASLECEMVFLDTDERRRFAQSSHEMLVEQVQFTGNEGVAMNNSHSINFNHPVKEIVWGIHNSRMANFTGRHKFLWYHPTDMDFMRLIATKRLVLAFARYDSENKLMLDNNTVRPNPDLESPLLEIFESIGAVAISNFTNTSEDHDSAAEPNIENIAILGDILTMKWASTPVDQLVNLSGCTRPTIGEGRASLDVCVRMPHNFGIYLDGTGNPLSTAILQLNGQDRFSEQDATYFNYIQPLNHHTRTPCDGLNVYSFAISPEEFQPSGTLNFSRIDTAVLKYNIDPLLANDISDSVVSVYGFSYNVLRIMSGMAGLAYSN